MVTVDELLAELHRRGARLTVDPDGRLATDAPPGAITDDLAAAIGAHRVEVLHRLGHPESAPARWERAMTADDRAAAALIRGHSEREVDPWNP
ncbi:hypothetical protein [Iamia sp.]|uniref:TubC N-terminal docking domain-related protein n=1 Tax=Iamia sp. TaxID=2722710 RepID=UPI002CF1B561|nr:hypothetical protein [Iamia sp.]HXH58916.1 hypothetical protein [Iamia sp.]